MKISQGDTVLVTAGKDKGKKGTVIRVLHEQNRVIVAGINMVTKHVKKTAESAGKKVRIEHSLHASNLMVIDPKSGKPTRVGYKVDAKTGKKIRIAKVTGAPLERVRIAPEDLKKKTPDSDTKAKSAKSTFWKKSGGTVASEETSTKAESGPAKSSVAVTRSGGRGS